MPSRSAEKGRGRDGMDESTWLTGDATEDDANYIFLGTVVAVARTDEDMGPLAQSDYWELQKPDPKQWVWTDDYSNIIGSILRKLRE